MERACVAACCATGLRALDDVPGVPARLAVSNAALPFQAHAEWYARVIIESNWFCDRKRPAWEDSRLVRERKIGRPCRDLQKE